jgi:pimeloyl-ACP methyl ester carboxylesterase
MPEMRLVGGDLDGLDLHYVQEGRGPVTVLIHGLGGFAESWRRTARDLARTGEVIALDLPGFGASSKPRRAYRLEFLARALHGLLDGLGADRVRLVGHSLGGAVAIAYTALFPERVERVALLGGCVPGFPFHPSMLVRVLLVPGLGELLSSLISPRICEASVARCQVRPNVEEVAFFVGYRYAERSRPEGRASYLATARSVRRDFASDGPLWHRMVSRIEQPVLVIHGRQDPVVSVDHAEAIARGLRRAEAYLLDQCGHFPQVEYPELVADRLAQFLDAPTRR